MVHVDGLMLRSGMTSFSLAQRVSHLRYVYRLALARGDVDALWDEPWHADLVRQFVDVCAHRKGISASDLATIHPDDLRAIFDDLGTPVDHRIVIRRYLDMPHIAFANLLTAVQVFAMATVVMWKFSRAVWRHASQLVVGFSAGLAVTVYFSSKRAVTTIAR